jgi:hypothetical protein
MNLLSLINPIGKYLSKKNEIATVPIFQKNGTKQGLNRQFHYLP